MDVEHQTGPPFRASGGKPGEVLAFHFDVWTAGIIAKLPQPPTAFGLDFYNSNVTDAGLKELAGLKSLQQLDLWGDAGDGRGAEGTGRPEEPANGDPW